MLYYIVKTRKIQSAMNDDSNTISDHSSSFPSTLPTFTGDACRKTIMYIKNILLSQVSNMMPTSPFIVMLLDQMCLDESIHSSFKFDDWMNPLKQSRKSVYPIVCICARESKGLMYFRKSYLKWMKLHQQYLPTTMVSLQSHSQQTVICHVIGS